MVRALGAADPGSSRVVQRTPNVQSTSGALQCYNQRRAAAGAEGFSEWKGYAAGGAMDGRINSNE